MRKRGSTNCDGCTVAGARFQASWAPMQTAALGLIRLRRETGARYARVQRLWVTAHNLYRRLHEAPVQDLAALRADLKALAD